MTCNNVILAQPQADSSVSYTIPEGDSARLNFNPDEISGLRVGDSGELIISFEDGGQLTITNFDDLASSGNMIYMADGTLIDPSILTSSLQTPNAFDNPDTALNAQIDTTVIAQPATGTTQAVSMQAGQKYVCDFDPSNAATVEVKDGQMILTFADGSQVIIDNYAQAMAGELPAELTVADGTAVEPETLLTEVTEVAEPIEEILELAQAEPAEEVLEVAQESVAEDLANIETAAGDETAEETDLAALAEELAEIETAAGETGGASGNSGYGFNSKPTDVPLNSPDAIGPLGPTQLAYNAPQVNPENVILSPSAPDDIPTIGFASEFVDETNLDNGNLVVTGTIDASYGSDTPGAITPTGSTQAVCGINEIDQLTSGGVPVIIESTTDGYIGTVNGDTVFTFTIDPTTGDFAYTQILPVDHPDTSDHDDEICINFGIKATDADGDSSFSNVRITIADDGPTLEGTQGTVDETDLSGTVVISGSVTPDYGQDGAGDVSPTGSFTSSGSQLGGTLTSGGVPVDVTFNPITNTYTGVAGGEDIFTMIINNDGSYTFELTGTLDHADPNNPNDIINLDFGIEATDADGDSAQNIIRIRVKDDVPTIGDSAGDVDETNLDGGPLVYTDSVDVNSLEPMTITVNDDANPSTALTHDGSPVTITSTGNTYTAVANGVTIFTLEVAPTTGQYTYTQFETLDHPDSNDHNDIISIDFGITLTAQDGTTDSGTITINIADDGPEATDDFNSAEEGQLITGDVVANDDGGEDGSTVTNIAFNGAAYPVPADGSVTIQGDYGLLVINSDGTYSYDTYDNDPEGTDVFTYTLTDTDGDIAVANLSIQVSPDGQPVAVSQELAVDETNLTPGPMIFNGALDVDFGIDGVGTVNPNGSFAASGSLAGGTLTSSGVPIVVSVSGNTYTGVAGNTTIFTVQINDDGTYNFQLFDHIDHADSTDPNDIITMEFGVTATDADGDAADGTFTIHVHDDAPVAYDDGTVTLSDSGNASGNVTDNDELGEDNPNNVVEIMFGDTTVEIPETGTATILGEYGTLTIASDGSYTYELDPNLQNNTTTTVSFDPSSADVDGIQSSIMHDGITIRSNDGQDLTWHSDDAVNEGIGIAGGSDSEKVHGTGEELEVLFDNPVNHATFTIGELEPESVGSTFTYEVYLEGSNTPIIETFTINANDLHNETYALNVSGYGSNISRVDLVGGPEFILNDVEGTTSDVLNTHDEFTYVLQDNDGDQDTATISFAGTVESDFSPININGVGETDDTNLAFGPDVENGTINVNYQGDGPGTTAGNGDFNSSGQQTGGTLSHNGVPVNVSFNAGTNTYTGTAGGTTVFTMVINENGTYTFTQLEQLDHSNTNDDNEALFLDFGVTATDSDGDTGTGTVRITVLDDGPEIGDIAKATDETNLPNGDLVVTGTVPHDYGQDGQGAITANGTFAATFQVGGTTTNITSGGNPITVTNTGNVYTGMANGQVAFTLAIDPTTGDYTYTQMQPIDHPDGSNPDDVIWLKFYVDITDGDGDTDTGAIIIDVHDDGPQAHDDSTSITNNGTTATGNVLTNDDAGADGLGAVTTPGTYQGAYGTLVLNTDGSYTYTRTGQQGGVDTFDYTMRDADGDTSTAQLAITVEAPDHEVDVTVNNSVDDVCVKEDGSVDIPVTANVTGGNGNEVLTLTLTGVDSAWDVTAAGWSNNGNGTYSITLPAGQTTYNGNFTFVPPADSDVDLNGLNVKATVFDPDSNTSEQDNDGFNITVDAVADAPTLSVTLPEFENHNEDRWDFSDIYNYSYWGGNQDFDFTINASVTDTDGSEELDYFLIRVPAVLADFGLTFSAGTEVSHGVWRIEAGDEDGLELELPGTDGGWRTNPDYEIPQGIHNFEVSVHTVEANLSGEECDHSDNTAAATVNVQVVIFSSPLVLDLDGDGVELLNIDEGVTFDMDNDGQAEQTGWVAADDGLLVLDKNEDGIINDRSELFGNTGEFSDGFANLASYDRNNDGVIDANDDVYDDLQVWQDANSDGVSDDGEMLSLLDIGVVSIFLNADMPEDLYVEGSWISHSSSFTTTDGSTHDIVDAWFETDEVNIASNDTLFDVIGESSDTLLALNEAGDDILDISQMLETSDDVTEAIQDFVHAQDDVDATHINDNVVADGTEQNGALASATALEELPQGGSDQIII